MAREEKADDDTGPIRRVPAEAPAQPQTHRRTRHPRTEDPAQSLAPRGGRNGQSGSNRGGTRRADRTTRHTRTAASHPGGDADDGAHGHAHGPATPASAPIRRLLAVLLVPFALAAAVGVLLLYPWSGDEATSAIAQGSPVHGEVTSATSGPCLSPGEVQVGGQDSGEQPCLSIDVRLTDGESAGTTLRKSVPIEPSTPRFAADDKVVLSYSGADASDPASYQLVDFQRTTPLLVLAGLFAVAVIVLGKWRGVAALGALLLSFVVLAVFVLPAILAGANPLLVAIAGSGVIMFAALYLTHGFSARTSVAVLGTMVSLALIGGLAVVFTSASALTGLDDDATNLIATLGHGIDTRGLLLAGVVIGALGVLDDVTVTQTSAVWELRKANPELGWRQLYAAGLRIGRDHVGSAVNTLVMAYAGAALPVLLYSSVSGVGLGSILGSQDIAQEIVRTLAGSVGLVAAVPVTTVLAAWIACREQLDEPHSPENTSTSSHVSTPVPHT